MYHSVNSPQDAFDAVGYFNLALAAALQDTANPEALYVVYMKLAEIHGNHIPDAQLCQVYTDRARSLKRVLAGGVSSDVGEENMDNAAAAFCQKEETVSEAENIFTSAAGKENCIIQLDPEKSHTDLIPPDRREDDGVQLSCPANLLNVLNESGAETTAGFTESFEMAREQISVSSSLTDTLRNYENKTDGSDSNEGLPHYVTNHSALAQTPAENEACDIREETDADLKKDSHEYDAVTDNAR